MREAKNTGNFPADMVDVRAVAPEQRYLIVELVAEMARRHPNWREQERGQEQPGVTRLKLV